MAVQSQRKGSETLPCEKYIWIMNDPFFFNQLSKTQPAAACLKKLALQLRVRMMNCIKETLEDKLLKELIKCKFWKTNQQINLFCANEQSWGQKMRSLLSLICFSSLVIGKWIEPPIHILQSSDPRALGSAVCIPSPFPGEVKCVQLRYKSRQGLLEETKTSAL